ncbi:MAG: aminoacyl-tRNA hydrolase [Gammaproteobacteria bacterium]
MASTTPIRVIVGLGNPGADYLRTRHNVGFWFLDLLADAQRVAFRPTRRFHAETARIKVGDAEVLLVKPETFVNCSGLAVRAVLDFFKHTPGEVLVAHDDMDLPVGVARLKRGGGHGGHNGLRDIIQHAGADFARLRFGVGHPSAGREVINYVLNAPGRDEEGAILDALAAAQAELAHLAAGEFDAATRALHNRKES